LNFRFLIQPLKILPVELAETIYNYFLIEPTFGMHNYKNLLYFDIPRTVCVKSVTKIND